MAHRSKSFLRAAKLVVLAAVAGASLLLMACEEAVPEPAPTPTPPPPPPSVDRSLGLEFMDDQAYRSAYVLRADSVSVPSSVDLSADHPPPGNQGGQGSCVGWAVAYAMKSYQERIERDWPLTNDHIFSAAYVYNQIKGPRGGAFLFDAFSLLVDQGVASLATMPYNPNDDRTQPSAAARREAANYKIADWGVVQRTSHATFVQEIKRHLAANTPVVIGIHTYPDFDNLNLENQIYDDASGFNRGGHAIVIVGYDDAKSAFKIINSWGPGWGINGYGWIDYAASERLIRVAYVADDVVEADVHRRPGAASTPVPDNTAEGVAAGAAGTTLSWARNERTTSFDVYVGTTRELGAVDFQGNVAQPTFRASLAPGSTYYWRIDARGAGGLTQGPVWSFTTAGSAEPPLKPTNPRPANRATAVSVGVSLSWDSGGRATSYDVYLGTGSSLGSSHLQRTQATRTFNPGTLVAGTRYYWRIDAKNSQGTTRGDTWSFTTAVDTVDEITPSVAIINPDVNRILKAGVLTNDGVYHSLAVGELADFRTGCAETYRNYYETTPGCWSGVGRQSDFIGQLLNTNGYDVSSYEASAMPAIDADDYDVVVVQDPLKTNGRAFTKASMEGSVPPDLLEHVTSSRFRSRLAAYHRSGGTLVLVGDAVRLLESGTNRLGANKSVRQVSVDNTVSKSNSLLATQWLFIRGNPFCGVDRDGSAAYTASRTTLLDSTGATLGRLRLFNGNDIALQGLWSDTVYAPTDGTSLLSVRVAGTGDYVLRGDVCSPPVHTVTVDETVTSFMGYTLWNNRKVFYIGSDSFFDYRFRSYEGKWHARQYLEIDFRVTEDGRRAILELVKQAAAE